MKRNDKRLEEAKQLAREFQDINRAMRATFQEIQRTKDPDKREGLMAHFEELKKVSASIQAKALEATARLADDPPARTAKEIAAEVEQDALCLMRYKACRGVALNVLDYLHAHTRDFS